LFFGRLQHHGNLLLHDELGGQETRADEQHGYFCVLQATLDLIEPTVSRRCQSIIPEVHRCRFFQ
jgi:hypothetical protein